MRHSPALLEAFEPRILYSADLAAVLGSVADGGAQAAHVQLLQTPQPADSLRQLAFVDLAIPDAHTLVAGLQAPHSDGRVLEVVTIGPGVDGLALISSTLQSRSDIAAIHLFSHGSAGQVQLGSAVLDHGTALQRATELAAWGNALTASADLLIYGCDVAAAPAGLDLMATLGALTGADVAASSDATGAPPRGGNWLLEAHTGPIETGVAVDAGLQQSWAGLLGNEFPVNTTKPNEQSTAALTRGSQQAVAVDAAGNTVVVWTSRNQDGDGDGVYARRFAWDGTPLSGEIQVNTTTAGNQNQARVAADAGGNFVVVWSGDAAGGGSGTDVFMRRFAANGSSAGAEVKVNTFTAGDQTNPVIGMNRTSGDFVVVWEGAGATDTAGVAFRRFMADGQALDAAERSANTTDAGTEANPAVAMDGNGRFVVAYDVANHMFFQRFDNAGLPAGSRTQVDNPFSNSTGTAIAMDDAGNFTLAYREVQTATGVWGRGYNADGSPRYSWFYTDSGDATSPSIAMAGDGAFVISYQKSSSNSTDILARKYNANGSPNGAAFAVNVDTTGAQSAPSVALLGKDDFVIVWSGKTPGDASGVMARSFEAAAAAPVITSNGGGDSASLQVAEGTTAVTTVTASDSNLPAQTLSFSIESGPDAARFAIDASSGVLRFVSPPSFASPTDADANNIYNVVVVVSDGTAIDKQSLSVTVLNSAQAPLAQPDSYALSEDQAFSASVASGWYDAEWSQRQAISFNNTTASALGDTVVRLNLDSSTVDYSRLQAAGQDLRFVTSDGQLLAHEIERWNSSGVSTVWVRVPGIAAAGTTSSIWMYSGNPAAPDGQQVAATWNSALRATVHMGSPLADATAQANPVTESGTTVANGVAGEARLFDGNSSWVSLGAGAALDNLFAGGGMVSAWINPSSWGEAGFGRIASKADSTFSAGANGNGWNLQLSGSAQSVLFEIGFGGAVGRWQAPTGAISLNTWQQVTLSYDSTSLTNAPQLFINGVAVSMTAASAPLGVAGSDAGLPLRIGNQALTTERGFAGLIDEVRVSSGSTTAAQALADYRASAGTLVAGLSPAQRATPGVLNNDNARNGAAMTAELASAPAHASSFSFNSDGTFSYTPLPNHNGSDSFSYRPRNSIGLGDAVIVNLSIAPVADAPVITTGGGAASFSLSLPEGTTAVTTLSASDADGTPPALLWSITGGADAALFVVDSASGALRFASAPRFESPADAGADNVYDVVVQVSDGSLSDSLALAVSVSDVQHAPVAQNDTYAVLHNTPLNVPASEGLLRNDTDADGQVLSVVATTAPAHGTLSLTPEPLPAFNNLSNNAAADTRPAWSPDGMRIAFDSARDGNNEIYVMAADGSGVTRLTNNAADDSQAAWSPDGSRIAFMSNRDGNHDLWLMNAADGSGLVQLAATTSGINGQPAWSPDGSRLAFTSNRSGGNFEIYVVNADGSGLTRLTNSAGNDDEPAWSPDGTRLAFTSARDGNSEIYVMNADGSGQTRLTNDAATDRTPDWSRYGDQLSFVSDRSGTQQIIVMGSHGANPVAVTSDPAGVSFADWSPNGQQMVFASAGEIQSAAIRFGGGFSYTPASGFGGSDSFSYTVTDSTGLNATATVTLSVQGASPTAVDDTASTTQPQAVTVNVLANDTAGPGGPLQLLDLSAPTQGTASIVGNQVVYAPTPGTSGTDTLRYRITDAGQQLVHYWKLDGDANDSVGSASGALLNGPSPTTGVFGGALQFDGVNDHVQLPDLSYSNEFTLSFWFKLADNNGTGYRYLYSHGSAGTANSLNVFFIENATTTASGAQNVLRTRLLDSDDADNLNDLDLPASTLADNIWHNYTLTTTAGVGTRVYIDGTLRAAISGGGDAINPSGNVQLGSNDTLSAARFLTGSLDGVALHARSLSAAEVQAQAGGGALTAAVTVTVSPAPQTAPVITSDGGGATATRTVLENSTAVTTVQASDSDLPSQALTYNITGGADAARFQIQPSTGALVFINAPNFEAPDDANQDGLYEVQVQASDGTLSDSQFISVQLLDQNEFTADAPADIDSAANSVSEAAPVGTPVGLTVHAVDGDGSNNTVGYSLDNNAGGRFAIDPVTGVVRVAAALDAETAGSHLVTVRATSSDGSASIGSFSIGVLDGNEFALGAVSDSDISVNSVPETAPAGTVVGLTVRAVDADATTNQVSYTLSDNAGGRFAINSTTGVVSLARALGEEGISSHSVTVLARSADGSTASQAFTIAVRASNNHEPVFSSLGGAAAGPVAVDENQLPVLTLAAADADLPAQALRFSLAGGADAALFSVDAITGALSWLSAPDFERPLDADGNGSYDLVAAVSDGEREAFQVITVQVRNVAEAPRWLSNSLSISEGGSARPGLAVADEDTPPAGLSLSVQGLQGGHFENTAAPGVAVTVFTQEEASRGLIRFVADGGETAPAYSLVLSDGSSTLPPQAAVVSFTPVNDAPVFSTPAEATVNVAENTVQVTVASATDADHPSTSLRFSLAGAADAALFSIDARTGALAFLSAPDHEQPGDANGDGRYELMLAVSDGSATTLQALTVQVGNVNEPPIISTQKLVLQGGTASVELLATDPDGPAAALGYEVLSTQGGHFEWQAGTAQAGTVASTFTQGDVSNSRVRFVQAASGEPGFQLALTDGVNRVVLGAPEVERLTPAPSPVPAPAPATTPQPTAATAEPAATQALAQATAPLPVASPAPAATPAPAPTESVAAPPVIKAEPAPATVPVEQRALQAADAPAAPTPRKADPAPSPSSPSSPSSPASEGPAAGSFWSNGLGVLSLPSETTPLLRELGNLAESSARSNSSLAQAMDATRAHDENSGPTALELGSAGTVLVSSGLSVGYVLWLVRGGVLAASLMSSVPAWASVDPLPVLAQMRHRRDGDEEDDDDNPDDAKGHGGATGGTAKDFDPIERLFSRARRLVPGSTANPVKEEASAWAS